MALVTHKFKLDLTPGASRQVLYTSQGDIGRPFEADLYWNGSPWTATGTTASIRGKKPDDTVFDYSATLAGSTVTFETTEQMTIISGPVECELVFSNDGDIIASANFVLIVEESPYDPDALSESVIPGIVDLIEDTIGGDVSDEVDAWLDAHPEVTTTVQDGAITKQKLDSNLQTVSDRTIVNYAQYVNAINDNNSNSAYNCAEITISETIGLASTDQCKNKSFTNAVFKLNADMFDWTNMRNAYKIPNFTNCTFVGNGHAIVKTDAYVLQGKFVNCTFINCSLVNGGYIAQSPRLVNCYFQNTSTTPFINAAMVYDAQFVNCQAEFDNDAPIVQATAGTSTLPSVDTVNFTNCIFESQSSNIVEMIDGSISFIGCYTEANSGSLIKVNATTKTNPVLEIEIYNTKLLPASGYYSVNVDESFFNSNKSSFVCRSCHIYKSLVNTNKFRKYVVENAIANSETVIYPSRENSRIGVGKNSVANFNVSKHILVYKYPCLLSLNSQVENTYVPFLYFVSAITAGGVVYPYVTCISDPSRTPTAAWDAEHNRIDVTMDTNGLYTSNGLSAVYLPGITNNFNELDYWQANQDGYSV